MNGPVDVLDTMDAVENWAREVSDQYLDGEDGMRKQYAQDLREFREARAAVAELVEALRSAEALAVCCMAVDGYSRQELYDMASASIVTYRAALVKVGSAK